MYFVYIMASSKEGTIYIGSTNNLLRRVWEHKNSLIKGFTNKYKVHNLVYFEQYEDIGLANQREANMKHWYRKWKLELVEKNNPEWKCLYGKICN